VRAKKEKIKKNKEKKKNERNEKERKKERDRIVSCQISPVSRALDCIQSLIDR
jgi:hypothetical protein